jgi:PRD1 phage membrane DNA delivery
MGNELVTALVSVVVAIISLAALTVVLSPNAKTSAVIGAGAGGLAQDIGAAVAPVSGGIGGIASTGSYIGQGV